MMVGYYSMALLHEGSSRSPVVNTSLVEPLNSLAVSEACVFGERPIKLVGGCWEQWNFSGLPGKSNQLQLLCVHCP